MHDADCRLHSSFQPCNVATLLHFRTGRRDEYGNASSVYTLSMFTCERDCKCSKQAAMREFCKFCEFSCAFWLQVIRRVVRPTINIVASKDVCLDAACLSATAPTAHAIQFSSIQFSLIDSFRVDLACRLHRIYRYCSILVYFYYTATSTCVYIYTTTTLLHYWPVSNSWHTCSFSSFTLRPHTVYAAPSCYYETKRNQLVAKEQFTLDFKDVLTNCKK